MNKKVSFLNNKIGFRPCLNTDQLSIFNGQMNSKNNKITMSGHPPTKKRINKIKNYTN